jgi:peptide/nickel transport system substrate-binding protein
MAQAAGHRASATRTGVARVLTAAVVAAVLLAACTGGDHGTASSGRKATGNAGNVAIDPHHPAPAAPIQGATPGGTVTVLSSADLNTGNGLPSSLDPTGAYFAPVLVTASILSELVTRSLTQYIYDPERRTMVLVPDIATDTGTPNADFTSWTFTIRSGVRFENGTDVTAADVAYGIKRSLDREDFPNGAPYSTQYFLGGGTYHGPALSGSDYSGVVVDGNKLTIKMARPFPDMPYWAAYPAMGPIPELRSPPATYGLHPLATGPYKVADFSPGKSITLVRNREWDPSTDPGRHAYPDRYRFVATRSSAQSDAIILGKSREGQTALSLDNVAPADYAEAQASGQVAVGPRPCTHILFPDNRKITDIRVREALGYAYPYRAMARLQGEIPDVTQLYGSSELPPGFPGRRHYTVVSSGRARPDKAQALLKAAGYSTADDPIIFVYNASDAFDVSGKDLMVKALTSAGFGVEPIRTTSGDQAARVSRDPATTINISYGFGWCPDWLSGNAMVAPVFASSAIPRSADDDGSNWEHFSQPSVDKAISRISKLPLEQQPDAWGLLDQTIMTKYYPLVVTDYSRAAKPFGTRIGGFVNDGVSGEPTLKDIYVRR